MPALTKLKLSSTTRTTADASPEQRMRSRLLEHLTQQLEMANALMEARPFKVVQSVRQKTEDGQVVTVEREKRLRPWYWHDVTGKWFLEVRYANKTLLLGKDQNAIEVGPKDNLVPTIQTVIEAVEAGELDAAMKAVLAQRKKPGKKA